MAFNIVLMRNKSETIKVTKKTETITTVSGVLKEATSIIDPVIKIECDLSTVTNCNYLSIPTFGRFYFVNNITSISNGIVEFSCHCDVLSSFATAIKANKAIIKRQENNWNLYINDGSFRVYQNPMVVTKNFPNGFNDHQFILAVAGAVNPSGS